jgi:hypothetical protein
VGDSGKAVFDAEGVMHVAGDSPYRATCGAEWVTLAFSWETRTAIHCRACIIAAVENHRPEVGGVV